MRLKRGTSAEKLKNFNKDALETRPDIDWAASEEINKMVGKVLDNLSPSSVTSQPDMMPAMMKLPSAFVGGGDVVWQFGNHTIQELENGLYEPGRPTEPALTGQASDRRAKLRAELATIGEAPQREVQESLPLQTYGPMC